jgi:hypothetical protein
MQNLIITLVFEKNANFLAENCQKSQKIVILNIDPWSPWSELSFCLKKIRKNLCV